MSLIDQALSFIGNRMNNTKVWCVDFGRDEHWYWKKWSDGTCDLWYHNVHAVSPYDSHPVFGGMYQFYEDLSFPFNLVDTEYCVTHSWMIGTSHTIPSTNLTRTQSSVRIYALTAINGAATGRINAHIFGRWK